MYWPYCIIIRLTNDSLVLFGLFHSFSRMRQTCKFSDCSSGLMRIDGFGFICLRKPAVSSTSSSSSSVGWFACRQPMCLQSCDLQLTSCLLGLFYDWWENPGSGSYRNMWSHLLMENTWESEGGFSSKKVIRWLLCCLLFTQINICHHHWLWSFDSI